MLDEPNYEKLKDLPVGKQIAYQLIELQKKMDYDLSALSPGRVIRVQYEHFCHQPELLVESLRSILGQLEFKNSPVTAFNQIKNRPKNKEEHTLIELLQHER